MYYSCVLLRITLWPQSRSLLRFVEKVGYEFLAILRWLAVIIYLIALIALLYYILYNKRLQDEEPPVRDHDPSTRHKL